MSIGMPATLAGLFTVAVVIGVLAMMLQNPKSTVQAMNAGADTINGVVHGLEGKQ